MANSMAALCVLAVVMTALVTGPARTQAQCNTNLLQALGGNPNLSDLVNLVRAADLDDELTETDNVTVLAPTNDAFAGFYAFLRQSGVSLEQATGDADNSENRAASILQYHIIQGPPRTIAMLTSGQTYPTTLAGYSLGVVKPSTVTFLGNATNATVLTPDQRVCNSVVHIVNRVLLPSGTFAAIPAYDDDTPAPGLGNDNGRASGLTTGAWALALSGSLAAALMM